MATVHNNANKDEISNIILMSGDPLRAKYIAENYLENYELVNDVRNMYAYTGFYKGKRITVMGHGMGIPSIAIYAYELFKMYDADIIIRLGSCGCYDPNVEVGSTILATSANTESSFAKQFYNEEIYNVDAFDNINDILKESAKKLNINLIESEVTSSDIFDPYCDIDLSNKNIKVAEMEAFALFLIAKKLNKKAGCLLTVSDNIYTKKELTSVERQKNLNNMILVALESTLSL
ncbi:MAG: purine-nucleoside phosphorylase [Bacilli bacterium]|nr:purine-nucleoside phosphorylase [Bacilli bacterium]